MRGHSVVLICTLLLVACSKSPESAPVPAATGQVVALTDEPVDVGCGQCVYGMEHVVGHTLAAVVSGQPMVVTGVTLDMQEHQLCSKAQRAKLEGKIRQGRIEATQIELVEGG
ncbi:MAG: DUF6370 family protein [Planctomycetota bacterium]|jgi:hypothetical protein